MFSLIREKTLNNNFIFDFLTSNSKYHCNSNSCVIDFVYIPIQIVIYKINLVYQKCSKIITKPLLTMSTLV